MGEVQSMEAERLKKISKEFDKMNTEVRKIYYDMNAQASIAFTEIDFLREKGLDSRYAELKDGIGEYIKSLEKISEGIRHEAEKLNNK